MNSTAGWKGEMAVKETFNEFVNGLEIYGKGKSRIGFLTKEHFWALGPVPSVNFPKVSFSAFLILTAPPCDFA